MFILSILAGLLSTMNVWTISNKHRTFHINDIYMVLLMTFWMMLFSEIYYYSHNIHQGSHQNISMIIISVIFIGVILYAIRKQLFINETQFLKGMIPHHSMAILMSERIKEKTNDPELIKLADNIIKTQEIEIQLMENMLKKN